MMVMRIVLLTVMSMMVSGLVIPKDATGQHMSSNELKKKITIYDYSQAAREACHQRPLHTQPSSQLFATFFGVPLTLDYFLSLLSSLSFYLSVFLSFFILL